MSDERPLHSVHVFSEQHANAVMGEQVFVEIDGVRTVSVRAISVRCEAGVPVRVELEFYPEKLDFHLSETEIYAKELPAYATD